MADDFQPVITIDASRVMNLTTRLIAALPQLARQIIDEEGLQAAKTMINVSPPLRYIAKGATRPIPAFKAGRDSVQRNISRAITPLSPQYMATLFKGTKQARTRERLIKLAAQGPGGLQAMLAIFANMGGKMARALYAGPGQFRAIHKEATDKYGRVNWRGIHFFTTDIAAWKSYVVKEQGRVGLLKSGWLAAYWGLAYAARGEEATAAITSVPQFVSRHGVSAGALVTVSDAQHPRLTIINRAVKYPREQELVDRMLSLREKSLRTKLSRVLMGRAVNLGFTTIEGTSTGGNYNSF